MQLLNTVQNEAIVSNVAEIGEFRIRNSAKAFNILSSGLYANKIRAIIRELSCNAVDSHVAAGRADTPFDIHLPTQLEPWFAIRDYGVGLNHNQVINIYTTYFESTKTDSNDYIGALGLGSKSPFSYTDNFTVTAIKDGVKGIYSAFINDAGIPSIAKMGEEETTEPAGVEVKFSVNDRWDFDKFYLEARQVYKWFKLRPVITSANDFTFSDVSYKEQNIIPGVHLDGERNSSTAVMGNIAYPIEVPNTDDLGEVAMLLHCGLIMEFDIGELDFQASREGLSYIPETVAAIKRKLEAVNAVLLDKIANEANAIKNDWDRAVFLNQQAEIRLYKAAVIKYINDYKFNLVLHDDHYVRLAPFKITEAELKKKFNMQMRGFEKRRGDNVCSTIKAYRAWGATTSEMQWDITPNKGAHFVVNDTKIGALERAKNHWRKAAIDYSKSSYHSVFVVEPADREKPMKEKAFFKFLHNPPADRVIKASTLIKKERTGGGGIAKDVTIMRLEKKGYGGYHTQRELVWRDAGHVSIFDPNTTHYYLPLSGFAVVTDRSLGSSNDFARLLNDSGLKDMPSVIYGVRKGDIEHIKKQANWVNLEHYLADRIGKLTETDIVPCLLKYVDYPTAMRYNVDIVSKIDPNSVYATIVTEIGENSKGDGDKYALVKLLRMFDSPISVEAIIANYKDKVREVKIRYPLIDHIYSAGATEIANYINLVDQAKGI